MLVNSFRAGIVSFQLYERRRYLAIKSRVLLPNIEPLFGNLWSMFWSLSVTHLTFTEVEEWLFRHQLFSCIHRWPCIQFIILEVNSFSAFFTLLLGKLQSTNVRYNVGYKSFKTQIVFVIRLLGFWVTLIALIKIFFVFLANFDKSFNGY